MKFPLTQGAYEARSVIANAQRCLNLFPESNTDDAPFPMTHYTTPGLLLKGVAPSGDGWRCLYAANNGNLYGVAGEKVYRIKPDFTFTELGSILYSTGPVYAVDNGIYVLMVDGTLNGYTIKLNTDEFATISSSAFYGSSRVDLADDYLLLNRPGTNQWYISKFQAVEFDALDFAAKTGFSDNVVAVAAAKRQVFVFGELTTEVWFNEGNTDFTFSRMPGAFIQHGCAAVGSIQQMDGSLYWLSRSPQGHCVFVRSVNYEAARISTHAIEQEISKYARIDDAIAYTYQQEGHFFYVVTFPAADKTWVYDVATQLWHERAWLDEFGKEHRHRSNCHAFWQGMTLVGDWENGNLYEMRPDVYQDNGEAIRRVRSFPHMLSDSNRVMYRELIAAMQVGEGRPDSFESGELRLRWSDTGGASWGSSISSELGPRGDHIRSLQFQRLGYARDRVFELSWMANTKTALNGVFLRVEEANE
ncbi:hypothetical protein [Pseudomonas aeruginosa]|uniref:hypothetical protein n=1 Tax=Pseudomonas aeruginosa TaxID=287 RepID=UPI000F538FCB|nr:hypothetical protein [Pseudomonas aeruginosa]RQE49364.1 hypothetical protein IPC308_12910 [Pseudomonas aeruginosa]